MNEQRFYIHEQKNELFDLKFMMNEGRTIVFVD